MLVSYDNSLDTITASEESAFEASCLEACQLLEKLLFCESRLDVEISDECYLNFYVESDSQLWVEITMPNFWAVSEISLEIGKEIIKRGQEDGRFGDAIILLNREWDAYCRM